MNLSFKQGQKLYEKYVMAQVNEQTARKAELDAQAASKKASNTVLEARRTWEEWMSEASPKVIDGIVHETLRKLEGN